MKVLKKNRALLVAMSVFFVVVLLYPVAVHAMHIMEGFLPVPWAIFWAVVSLPFLILGIKKMRDYSQNSHMVMLMALTGAYIFVLSAMKIPSVTGSCSHPTGSGLAAIFFGPMVSGVLSLIVLIFQAVLLAHGGITTLGANVFSMGILGPICAYYIFRLIKGKHADYSKDKKRILLAVFAASALGDLMTYVMTSLQLALAHPGESMWAAFIKFASIFAVTQTPLAIIEGLVTMMIFSFIAERNRDELNLLKITE